MTNPTTAVNPSTESLAALAALPDEDPIVMVNLLKFAASGGRKRYAEYAKVASQEIASRGGHVLYSGQFVERSQWDSVALAYYPRRAAFLDMQQSPKYQAAIENRTAGLDKRLLFAFKQGKTMPSFDPIARADDDEIYVVNLLRFKTDGGANEYQKYGTIASRMIDERGGRVALYLEAEQAMVSDDEWQRMILVRYPSLETLKEMTSSEKWRKANSTHRQAGLANTIAIPSKPLLR